MHSPQPRWFDCTASTSYLACLVARLVPAAASALLSMDVHTGHHKAENTSLQRARPSAFGPLPEGGYPPILLLPLHGVVVSSPLPAAGRIHLLGPESGSLTDPPRLSCSNRTGRPGMEQQQQQASWLMARMGAWSSNCPQPVPSTPIHKFHTGRPPPK